MSQHERDRLKVLHEVEQGHLPQVEATRRMWLSDRKVRRLQVQLGAEGDRGVIHRLRGRSSGPAAPSPIPVLYFPTSRSRSRALDRRLLTAH